MNLISKAFLPIILALSFNISADDHVQEAPYFVPLETMQCNFNENKDLDDLMKLQAVWNKFIQGNEEIAYAAWVITPLYRLSLIHI